MAPSWMKTMMLTSESSHTENHTIFWNECLMPLLTRVRFCEEDIDQILERRAHVIQLESEGKGSTFSKVRIDLHVSCPHVTIM